MDSRTAVKVCLFTDLVGSTELKRRLGDSAAVALMSRHDALFHELLSHYNGIEAGDTGDWFFATFDRPSDAVCCALAFQQALAALDRSQPLGVRIGIHMGEMSLLPAAGGKGRTRKLLRLTVDTAARIMGLAEPGQILLTRHAFDSGRQYVREAPDGATIQWVAHGPYLLKGLDDAMEVFEVGVAGLAPLRPPADSEKVRRFVLSGAEDTLGWRPAVGLTVPGRKGWVLDRKVETTGLGETWVARQAATGEARAYRFCFEAEQVRALKRELALLRLMKQQLGERPDIVRLYDVRLDEPPYYLEMEFTAAGNLVGWAAAPGGLVHVPLRDRLELVVELAEALAAAHSAGVVHKDIRPANVLIEQRGSAGPRARLTGFGIGQLTHAGGLAATGMTTASLSGDAAGPTGRMLADTAGPYVSPELRAGHGPTAPCDIYALGVLLFQMVLGDLARPLERGWAVHVADARLRDDIAACVAESTSERLRTADELARRLRALPDRKSSLPEVEARGVVTAGRPTALGTDAELEAELRHAFSGYEVMRELHRGGQGVVYLAIQKATSRKAAIKALRGGAFASPADKARFEREVRVLAQLDHANIVTIHDSGASSAGSFFVMDYVVGASLNEWMTAVGAAIAEQTAASARDGSGAGGAPGGPSARHIALRSPRAAIAEALKLLAKICSAVNAAHVRGIVHRDLKPSDIRLDARGEPRILDFSLARTGGVSPVNMASAP